MESDFRYILLKHIDSVALSSPHAHCLDTLIRNTDLALKSISDIDNIKGYKEQLQSKKLITIFTNEEKHTLKTLSQEFLASLNLYNLLTIQKDIIDWYQKLFELYLLRSLKYHVTKELKASIHDLSLLMLKLLFVNVETPKNKGLNMQWEYSAHKPLIDRIIDSVSYILEGRVNRRTILVNFSATKFTVICNLVGKIDINERPTIRNFNILKLMYQLNDSLSLFKELKLGLRDISILSCKRLNTQLSN